MSRGVSTDRHTPVAAIVVSLVFLLAGLMPAARPSRVPVARQPWSLVVPNVANGTLADLEVGSRGGPISVRVDKVDAASPQPVELTARGYSIASGRRYCLRFRARSSTESGLVVSMIQDHAPWRMLTDLPKMTLNEKWHDFEHSFIAIEEEPECVIRFAFDGVLGTFELDNVCLLESQPAGSPDS